MLATGLAAALLLPAWRFLDRRYEDAQRAEFRAQVKDRAASYAAGLANAMNRRLALIDGLYAFVQSQLGSASYETDLKSFAAGLYAAAPGIRAIEVIPGSRIRFIYPLAGNEAALGHDLSTDPRPEVRADLERARTMRRSCVTGPIELRQGGLGLIVRRAVFRQDQFWGFVTIILDVKPILQEVAPEAGPIAMAMRDAQDRVFEGDPDLFRSGVIEKVVLPDGDWEVAVGPLHGWDSMPDTSVVVIRVLLLSLALAVCGVIYLFTERQSRLSQAVREGEAEYRLVTDTVPVLIAAFDNSQRCRFANITHESWFDRTRDELLGQTVADILGENVSASITRHAHLLAAGTPVTFDAALPVPDSGPRYVTITCVPRRRAGAAPDGLYLVATDLTARKKAEEERQQLAALVEMSRESIGIATLEGKLVYLNPAGLAMAGFDDVEEARGASYESTFAPSHQAQARDEILPVVLNSGSWTGESQLRSRKTGAVIDVELTAFQIRGADGAALYLATITRDVTERCKAAAERTLLQEQLQRARKMESIGRLAGGVAHDFNNLLTIINGFTELSLKTTGSVAEIQPYLAEVDKAGRRAADLTRQLLTFSRRQVIDLGPLDPAAVISGMESMLRALVGADVRLVTSLPDDTWTVLADQGQLEQVIMNLAINARDAMPEGGLLTIEAANVELDGLFAATHPGPIAGPHVRITVADNGVGMDAETREQIFEPFFTTKQEGAGTGLGLATVFGIVQQCHGWIDVLSEPGEGATFCIYLPRAAAADSAAEAIAEEQHVRGRETILVVDDNPDVREFTVLALRGLGYTVLDAGSGPEALALLERHPGDVHLVLTDVVMPAMNGRKLASLIQAQRPEAKVLYMSGYTGKISAPDGVLPAGVELLSKPFTSATLGAKVRKVLGPPTPPARPRR